MTTDRCVISFYRMHLEIQRTLLRCTGETELWQALCELVVGQSGVRLAWAGLWRGERLEPVASAARPQELLMRAWPCLDIGLTVPGRTALESMQVQCVDRPELLPPRIRAAGLRAACALPLRMNGRLYGLWEWYGERDWFSRKCSLLEDLAQELTTSLAHRFAEIREFRRLSRLAALAYRDSLTGLFNRRFFDAHLRHTLERVQGGREGMALLLLDLDNFKRVNDRLGHAAGDRLLCRVARVLRERLPQGDVAFRLGGDEFAAVLALRSGSADDAARVARDLLEAVKKLPPPVDGIPVGASIGIALYPGHGDTPEKLLQFADEALYRAKAGGRNRFSCTA